MRWLLEDLPAVGTGLIHAVALGRVPASHARHMGGLSTAEQADRGSMLAVVFHAYKAHLAL